MFIDDYEYLGKYMQVFLTDYFLPIAKTEINNFKLVVVGRDELTKTSTVWKQKYSDDIEKNIEIVHFTEKEARNFSKTSEEEKNASEDRIKKLLKITLRYPYLLDLEISKKRLDVELGTDTAIGVSNYCDRITKWMSGTQKEWLYHLCFLDKVDIPSIRIILPEVESANVVFEWFKSDASVRSPETENFQIIPVIKTKLKKLVKIEDEEKYYHLEKVAKEIREKAVKRKKEKSEFGVVDE